MPKKQFMPKKSYGPNGRYELTAAHRAKLPEWRDNWIAIALRTEPQTDDDRKRVRLAMRGMYQVAKLEPPKCEVFAASPISAAVAAGVASGVWWCRDNPKESEKLFGRADEARLMAALRAACELSVRAGMGENVVLPKVSAATRDAADDATAVARVVAATETATYTATRAATNVATNDTIRFATETATDAAAACAADELRVAARRRILSRLDEPDHAPQQTRET